jgi:hypothetical protein
MKTTIAVCSAAIILSAITFHAGAEIVAGPITNPANGHDYYLLSPNSWTMSEAEAESLGGTLAIIKNDDEQKWIFSKFGAYGGTNRNLWIGLYRTGPQRSLVWATGEKLDYANWAGGQPDDTGGIEGYVFMASANRPWGFPAGAWNDYTDNGGASDPLCGVVEVPGKSNEKSLTEKEKSLVGTWYESGRADHPCRIAATENMLFAIDDNRNTSRAIYTTKGFLFASNARMHGEIANDKILWSNGRWWSRTPAKYEASEKSEAVEK